MCKKDAHEMCRTMSNCCQFHSVKTRVITTGWLLPLVTGAPKGKKNYFESDGAKAWEMDGGPDGCIPSLVKTLCEEPQKELTNGTTIESNLHFLQMTDLCLQNNRHKSVLCCIKMQIMHVTATVHAQTLLTEFDTYLLTHFQASTHIVAPIASPSPFKSSRPIWDIL